MLDLRKNLALVFMFDNGKLSSFLNLMVCILVVCCLEMVKTIFVLSCIRKHSDDLFCIWRIGRDNNNSKLGRCVRGGFRMCNISCKTYLTKVRILDCN